MSIKKETVALIGKLIKEKKLVVSTEENKNIAFEFTDEQDVDDLLFSEYNSIYDKDNRIEELLRTAVNEAFNFTLNDSKQ